MSLLAGLLQGVGKGMEGMALMGYRDALEEKKQRANTLRERELAKYKSGLETEKAVKLETLRQGHREDLERLKQDSRLTAEDRKFANQKTLAQLDSLLGLQKGKDLARFKSTLPGNEKRTSSGLYNATTNLVVDALGGTILGDGMISLPKDADKQRAMEALEVAHKLNDKNYNPGVAANAAIDYVRSGLTKEESLAKAEKEADTKDTRGFLGRYTPFGKSEEDVFGSQGRQGFIDSEQQRIQVLEKQAAAQHLRALLSRGDQYQTAQEVKSALESGDLTYPQAAAILKDRFGAK